MDKELFDRFQDTYEPSPDDHFEKHHPIVRDTISEESADYKEFPEFTINLDLSPYDRFQEVAKHFKD